MSPPLTLVRSLVRSTLVHAVRNPLYVCYSGLTVLSVIALLGNSDYSGTFSAVIQWVLVTGLIGALRVCWILSDGYLRLLSLATAQSLVADDWADSGRRSAAALLRSYVRANLEEIVGTFDEVAGTGTVDDIMAREVGDWERARD